MPSLTHHTTSSRRLCSSGVRDGRWTSPRLLADIGGTNARFALEWQRGAIEDIHVLACCEYKTLSDAIRAYLDSVGAPDIRHAAIAIANPVTGDEIHMMNHHWRFSIEQSRCQLGWDTLLVVNDFTALAHALPFLSGADLMHVGGSAKGGAGVLGLIGAGTGLGVGGLVPGGGGGWRALESEGGHATFAPSDEIEIAILQYCWRSYPHVSFERLVSGPGIELIYRALCEIEGYPIQEMHTAAIIEHALADRDALCTRTVSGFCAMLGTVASNVAITLGALGGMYIGGGIVPRLGTLFAQSPFRERFENKGRLGAYLASVPTWVIRAPYPAFAGVSAILEEHLQPLDGHTRPHTARAAQGCRSLAEMGAD